MKLIPISERLDAPRVLYELLEERPRHAWISHKGMPTWEEHCEFVKNHPYKQWYLILSGDVIGSIYLTKQREIGIFVYRMYHRLGYAESAIAALIELHGPGYFYANVAPDNEPSHKLFAKMGFKPIQITHCLEVA